MDLVAILVKTPWTLSDVGRSKLRPDRLYVVEKGVFPDISADEKIVKTMQIHTEQPAENLLIEFAKKYKGRYVRKASPLQGKAWAELQLPQKLNSETYFDDYFHLSLDI